MENKRFLQIMIIVLLFLAFLLNIFTLSYKYVIEKETKVESSGKVVLYVEAGPNVSLVVTSKNNTNMSEEK